MLYPDYAPHGTRMSVELSRWFADIISNLPSVEMANEFRFLLLCHDVLETNDDFSPELKLALEEVYPLAQANGMTHG